MRHVPDGMLRRLDDEPLAVPDRVSDHLLDCGRCRERRAAISQDRQWAAQVFAGPHLVPDVDAAWARLERELRRSRGDDIAGEGRPLRVRGRWNVFPRLSLRAGLSLGALTVLVAGTAAAASLSTIFAPTRVAPVSLSRGDLGALSSVLGLGNRQPLGAFATPAGHSTLRFGTIRWSSAPARQAVSAAEVRADTGLPMTLPRRLPAGVAAAHQFIVQPRANATVTFGAGAGSLAGSTVTVQAGPAVFAEYSGREGNGVPTLGIAMVPRPTALSNGASMRRIEAFLLSQPGVPPQLAEEIRLLGDLRTTLPIPVPAGASVHSVQVAGWPGVLLADPSGAASGVVWEDGGGVLHVVAGLLDSHDVLDVAGQLG